MQKNFANTSVLWAYNMINPALMAAKVDIWHLAVLWLYGGVYIDIDSGKHERLSTVITDGNGASFLYGVEYNSMPSCYASSHPFNGTEFESCTGGKVVQNWLLISSPRHPVLAHALQDVVLSVRDLNSRKEYIST